MSELLTTEQAARVLGLQAQTLRKWRLTGEGPAYVKIGSRCQYDPAIVQSFIDERRRTSTADAGSQGVPR